MVCVCGKGGGEEVVSKQCACVCVYMCGAYVHLSVLECVCSLE